MRPVDIKIEDKFKFGLVAFLVDRDDFLKDLERIRNHFHLKGLIPYEKVLDHLKEMGQKAVEPEQKTDSLDYIQEDKTVTTIITSQEFVGVLRLLEKKYKKNSSYDMVLARVILSGVVKDSELRETAYMQYLDENVLKNFTIDGHSQISIVVSRDTRVEEVERIFNTDVQKFFKETLPKPDTFPNITRNRDWYWKKKIMSWEKLLEYAKKSKDYVVLRSLRNAVTRYELELKKKLYSTKPPVSLSGS